MSRAARLRSSFGLRTLARRLRRNADGVAAVEFGFIAPVMLLMLIGTIEISRAVSMDRRLGMVTSMVADLVAREKTMTAANLDAIYDIVEHIMSPYDTSSLKLEVIPVKAASDDAANTKVYADTSNRPGHNGVSPRAKCEAYTLTTGLVDAGASVIIVESSYDYEPLFVNSITGAVTWTDKATLAPRNSCVDFDGDNCISDCFN